MKIDLHKTLSLVRGGLLDHESTWNSYFESPPPWQDTATHLTAPLIIANTLLSAVLSRMIGGYAMYSSGQGFVSALLFSVFMAVVGFTVAVFIFNTLAGTFGGKRDISRAVAAVSFGMLPVWIAGIVGALIPMLGFIIFAAGGIMTLIFLYRIMPLALGVPQESRVKHFVSSLVIVVVIQFFLGFMLGSSGMRQVDSTGFRSGLERTTSPNRSSGVLGNLERQGRLIESANSDSFDPPGDDQLSRDQVKQYVSVLNKTRNLQEEYTREMQDLAKDLEDKEKSGKSISASDLGRLYSGAGNAVGLNNAEMEIVKTGGGNWAEHVWVKEQLRAAKIHQGDGSDALQHNYKLYLEFKDELEPD